MASAEDMLQCLCDQTENGWEGIVIIDLPRATREDAWWKIACALETIKSGILYDKDTISDRRLSNLRRY